MRKDRDHRDEQDDDDDPPGKLRIDKWLWAARFFKTRSLAVEAIDGGRVSVNGERAKRAKQVTAGNEVRVRSGPYETIVIVQDVSARRGPASQAQQLYEETAESKAGRERIAAHMKTFDGGWEKGKPTKRDRRDLDRFRGR
jgi:ribosome-associated heat shock protein Hsp15